MRHLSVKEQKILDWAAQQSLKTKNNKMDIEFDWGPSGFCPVQAEGMVNGKEFYFRSRGAGWHVELYEGKRDKSSFLQYGEYFRKWPDAGYINEEQAKEFITKAAKILFYAMEPK